MANVHFPFQKKIYLLFIQEIRHVLNFKIKRPGSIEGHKYLQDLKASDNNLFLIFTVCLEETREQNKLDASVGTWGEKVCS